MLGTQFAQFVHVYTLTGTGDEQIEEIGTDIGAV